MGVEARDYQALAGGFTWGTRQLAEGDVLRLAVPIGQQLVDQGLAAELKPDGTLKRRRGRPKKGAAASPPAAEA